MHLVLVPRVQVQEPEGLVFRPLLPASLERGHGWGQASSEWERDGKVLCWVRGTSAEIDAIAAQAGSQVLGRCAPDAESARMVTALRSGDTKIAHDEFLAAYRGAAESEERTARVQRGVAHAAYLVAVVGLLAAAAWLASFLGIPAGAALSLVVLRSDNFTRANGALHGSTMSDGVGVWSDDATLKWAVLSNALQPLTNNGEHVAHDSSMADVANQRASITHKKASPTYGGPLVRWQSVTDFYLAYIVSNDLRIAKSTSAGKTLLASGGGAVAQNDVAACDATGTSISGLKNGSVVVGPATDSAYATGKAGMYAQLWNTTGDFDDFQVEVEPAGAVLRAMNEGALAYSGGAL